MSIYEVIKEHKLVGVASAGLPLGYEFDEFRAYYSPDRRRYYWYEDSGCSCYSFGDDAGSLGELYDGDRAALLRAFREWGKSRLDNGYDSLPAGEYESAITAISTHTHAKSLKESA